MSFTHWIYHRLNRQDTCVALQALSKYSEKTAGAKLDLRVSVSSEKDANWKRKYHVDADNALLLRQEEVGINKKNLRLYTGSKFPWQASAIDGHINFSNEQQTVKTSAVIRLFVCLKEKHSGAFF